jgi:colanic acid/amylovoran biosynthesis glycosyltransferase
VRVAYVMSRFPKLTETFILYEILALERQGIEVELYPLLREPERVLHPEAVSLVERARYLPFLSWAILGSQLHFLRRRPRAYLGALGSLVAGTWGSFNYFFGGLAIFPKVVHAARLMVENGIGHVHCHFSNHPATAGFVIRRLTETPYSFTAHGSDLHRDRRMLCRKVAEADTVVAISDYNRGVILHECGGRWGEKVVVLHSGVDTEFFRPVARDGARSPFTVLCVGSFEEVKGQTHLIEACRRLVESGLDVVCQLIGDGPLRAELERQIDAAGVGSRIRLMGRRTRDEVAAALGDADVLVAPSVPTARGDREGIPVVLMEAMASGLPVVASSLSGIPELVVDGETGLLTSPGDPAALADALRTLHDDPALRRRLGAAGSELVRAEFDVARNAAALARHFAAAAR